MSLSLPSNPTTGDTVSVGDRVYRWTGASWDVVLSFVLPVASASTVGGVRIGSGVAVDSAGVLTVSGLGPLATLTTSGTASSSTYLRGDGQWTAVSSGTTYTAGSGITIASGTISAAVTQVAGRTGAITLTSSDIGGLAASATTDTTSATNISSGTLSASRLPTSGVTAGTYTSVTVDTYGRVTAGSNPSSGGKSLGLILALT